MTPEEKQALDALDAWLRSGAAEFERSVEITLKKDGRASVALRTYLCDGAGTVDTVWGGGETVHMALHSALANVGLMPPKEGARRVSLSASGAGRFQRLLRRLLSLRGPRGGSR